MSEIPMPPIAHSGDPDKEIPDQPYEHHIMGVLIRALACFDEMIKYYRGEGVDALRFALGLGSIYHDLGKLDELAQEILHNRQGKLLNHVEAGVSYLLRQAHRDFAYFLAAVLVDAHHIGICSKKKEEVAEDDEAEVEYKSLICLIEEFVRGTNPFKSDRVMMEKYDYYQPRLAYPEETVAEYVSRHIDEYLKVHNSVMPPDLGDFFTPSVKPWRPTIKELVEDSSLIRFMQSCLVEGDHFNTGYHYGQPTAEGINTAEKLRARERLRKYNKVLRDRPTDFFPAPKNVYEEKRNEIRRALFEDVKRAKLEANVYLIPGTPGSGKTSLGWYASQRVADKFGLRGVIWTEPFNNLLVQNARCIRNFSKLAGEDPDMTVVEHHRSVKYFDIAQQKRMPYRIFKSTATLWQSPVVFTSIVQFAETCAGHFPSKIRKAHVIPGSVIVIDEFHTSVPLRLLRSFFLLLRGLVKRWSCKIILMSGSPVEYWKIEKLMLEEEKNDPILTPQNLISEATTKKMMALEKKRVKFKRLKREYSPVTLAKFVMKRPGPRIVVCNTVATAAIFANTIRFMYDTDEKGFVKPYDPKTSKVVHISTALTPADREDLYDIIEARLDDPIDKDWVLVATPCVDTGADFSFRTGFRESSSLMALLQLAGRVNRHNELNGGKACMVYDFRFKKYVGDVTTNPNLYPAIAVLGDLFDEKKISHEYCTEAIAREIEGRYSDPKIEVERQKLRIVEQSLKKLDYARFAEKFNMIPAAYYSVIVNEEMQQRVSAWIDDPNDKNKVVMPSDIAKVSVQIYFTKVDRDEFSTNIEILDGPELNETKDKHIKMPKHFRFWTGEYDRRFLGYMKQILKDRGHRVD